MKTRDNSEEDAKDAQVLTAVLQPSSARSFSLEAQARHLDGRLYIHVYTTRCWFGTNTREGV